MREWRKNQRWMCKRVVQNLCVSRVCVSWWAICRIDMTCPSPNFQKTKKHSQFTSNSSVWTFFMASLKLSRVSASRSLVSSAPTQFSSSKRSGRSWCPQSAAPHPKTLRFELFENLSRLGFESSSWQSFRVDQAFDLNPPNHPMLHKVFDLITGLFGHIYNLHSRGFLVIKVIFGRSTSITRQSCATQIITLMPVAFLFYHVWAVGPWRFGFGVLGLCYLPIWGNSSISKTSMVSSIKQDWNLDF